MTAEGVLERGRVAFARRAWGEALAELTAAASEGPLGGEDLERLAIAAQLAGRDDLSLDAFPRAYNEFLRAENLPRAARCAFWLTMILLIRGEEARANGWLARGRRLLDDAGVDCAEHGYLLVPVALQALLSGEAATAHATFDQAAKIGDHFGDPDVTAFGRLGLGQSLLALGQTAAGLALFDEVMVAVTTDELSPMVAGIVYCAVISDCRDSFDLRRAGEWTAALHDWCNSQPGIVTFRGVCMVHRAEIMHLHGAWADAMEEARRACERLSAPTVHPAVGDGLYKQGEFHRLRGDFAQAEEAYRHASEAGRDPEPGLARLRLAQGRVDAAVAASRRVVDETVDLRTRSRVLAAHVEIVLTAEDVPAARAAADELAAIAAEMDTPYLRAASAQASGAVLLVEDDPRAGLAALRQAFTAWQALDVPYEAARARVLIGTACRMLGDDGTAELEFDAAPCSTRSAPRPTSPDSTSSPGPPPKLWVG